MKPLGPFKDGTGAMSSEHADTARVKDAERPPDGVTRQTGKPPSHWRPHPAAPAAVQSQPSAVPGGGGDHLRGCFLGGPKLEGENFDTTPKK